MQKSHAKRHDGIAKAMKNHQGKELKTADIKDICEKEGLDPQWVFPSDHCSNSENKGMCERCKDDSSIRIFTKVKHGLYRVNTL